MGTYDDLVKLKGGGTPFDNLVQVSPPTVLEISGYSNGFPKKYLEFLSDVGAGELGDAGFMLYDEVVEPSEVYGPCSPELDGILIFGDDFQGFNFGFKLLDWGVVEIDPSNMSVNFVVKEFDVFIRRLINNLS